MKKHPWPLIGPQLTYCHKPLLLLGLCGLQCRLVSLGFLGKPDNDQWHMDISGSNLNNHVLPSV